MSLTLNLRTRPLLSNCLTYTTYAMYLRLKSNYISYGSDNLCDINQSQLGCKVKQLTRFDKPVRVGIKSCLVTIMLSALPPTALASNLTDLLDDCFEARTGLIGCV